MYITDATHFLDERGAIGPKEGRGLTLAEFFGSVIAAATSPVNAGGRVIPSCIQCAAAVATKVTDDGSVEWKCTGCDAAGRIANWRNTLWDMTSASAGPTPH